MPGEEIKVKVKELPVIRVVGIKYARKMVRNEGYPILAVLWEDDAITSVVLKNSEVVCAHTELRGGTEGYFAWLAHLAAKGWREYPLEVE